jgi:DNA-binding transcriptional LysR family regulator
MNTRRLEYFLTLSQTGNLRKASEILNVTPPALSKAMKVLEAELDVKLWAAEGRNVTLIAAGEKPCSQGAKSARRLSIHAREFTN